MNRYQKLVVPLGLLGKDRGAISWAAEITRLANSSEVLFLHSFDVPEIPAEAKDKYPWLMQPLDEVLLNKMKELVEPLWDGRKETALDYRVVSGKSSVLAILQAVVDHDSDLIVVGHEAFGNEMAVRLARKGPCSVMSVPVDTKATLHRILVPTDFSEYAKVALDVALAFAEAGGIRDVDSLHVYNLGYGAGRATISEEQMLEMAETYAIERHKEFLKEADLRGIHVQPHELHGHVLPAEVLKMAQDVGSDLVVVGCRGKDTLAAILLGSNSERLLRNANVPVIAAKAKGTGQKLLKALLAG